MSEKRIIEYNLIEPIKLDNGEELTTLKLCFDGMKYADLKTARRIRQGIVGDQKCVIPKLDPDLQFGFAFVAALKSTPGLTLDDVVKLSPLDVFELSEVCADNYFFR